MAQGYLRGDVIQNGGKTFTLEISDGTQVSCVFSDHGPYAHGFNGNLRLPFACHIDGEVRKDSEGRLYFLAHKVVSLKTALAWDKMEAFAREKEEKEKKRRRA